MTIINPSTFLAFAGVFAGLGLFAARGGTLVKGGLILAGAFSGSMLWWLTLIAAASAMRRHAPMRLLTAINALLGAVVLGFGVLTFLHTVLRSLAMLAPDGDPRPSPRRTLADI